MHGLHVSTPIESSSGPQIYRSDWQGKAVRSVFFEGLKMTR